MRNHQSYYKISLYYLHPFSSYSETKTNVNRQTDRQSFFWKIIWVFLTAWNGYSSNFFSNSIQCAKQTIVFHYIYNDYLKKIKKSEKMPHFITRFSIVWGAFSHFFPFRERFSDYGPDLFDEQKEPINTYQQYT